MAEQSTNAWIQRFNQHPVHQTLVNATAALEPAENRAKDDFATLAGITRIRSGFDRARAALASCEPDFVAGATLDNLNSAMANAAADLGGYAADGNSQRINNANGHIDSLILTLPAMVSMQPTSGGITEAITAFHAAVDKHLGSIRNDADAAKTGLEGLRSKMTAFEADISNQKSRLDTAIAQFSQQAGATEADRTAQFGQGELARQNQAAANEEQRRVMATSSLETFKADFAKVKTEGETALSDVVGEHQQAEAERAARFEESVEEQRKVAEALAVDLKRAAEAVVAKIEDERVKAEKIVHVVGNTGMVGGYQKTANVEQFSARIWSGVTVAAMVTLVAGAFVLVVETPDTFSWSYLASRIFIATAVAILATYSGRQAALHRDEARSLRRIELEIASIDPYLALLPEADRFAVKRLLAERMFARATPSRDAENAAPTGSAADVLKASLDTIRSGFEAIKGLGEKK